MKNKQTLIIILVCILAAVLLAYFLIYPSSSKKRFAWYESYAGDSEQPYGTSFVRQLLEKYRPGRKFTFNKNKPLRHILDSTTSEAPADYVFIGPNDYLEEEDATALLEFIGRGNNAFIACKELPYSLIEEIHENDCDTPLSLTDYREEWVTANFFHPDLKKEKGYRFSYRLAGIDYPYYWDSFDTTSFCNEHDKLVPLGYQQGSLVNFIRIPYEKGRLFIHTNPLAFTNYFMIEAEKVEYASIVFSHLGDGDIIWDEYSKMPLMKNKNAYDSPLYFILAQPSLKYAWWMILLTALLFIIFAAKRKQKVIPVIEPKSNTSLEYVTMISALHYQNGDHLDMARKKMKYFLYFIRARYGIHTPAFTLAHVPVLAEKSRVKEEDLQHLFYRWNVIDKFGGSGIEDFRLTDLYQAIDSFYKQCK